MIVTKAMDVLLEPARFEKRLYSNCNVLNVSTVAKLTSVSSPSYLFLAKDSSPEVISTSPDKYDKGCGKLINVDGTAEEFQNSNLRTSELLFRCLNEQNPKPKEEESSQNIITPSFICGSESRPRIKSTVNNPSAVASIVDTVEHTSLVASGPDAVYDENSLRKGEGFVEEHVDVVHSDGSHVQPISLDKSRTPYLAPKGEDHDIKNAECLEIPKPRPLNSGTDFTQDERLRLEGPCPEGDVPSILLEKPADSDKSGTSYESAIGRDREYARNSDESSPSGSDSRHKRGSDGVWEILEVRLRASADGEFIRYPLGATLDSFLPIPGDILITDTPRRPFVDNYLEPNAGGNVTVFVDRNYFERDQRARDDMVYQMSRFFSENDMIIRYGKFLPGWRWQPHAHIEFFVYRGGPQTGRRWYAYSRLPNNLQLGPPDPYNPVTMVYNRLAPPIHSLNAFVPRTTDIIIRPAEGRTYYMDDGSPMFSSDTDFLDGDLVLRPSIEKWPSNQAYLKFTVDLYMFERVSRRVEHRWVFRGRDVQLFGPPQLDHMGREQVLDLNGIEPFVRRPIPHWGLHEAVFGARGPHDLPP